MNQDALRAARRLLERHALDSSFAEAHRVFEALARASLTDDEREEARLYRELLLTIPPSPQRGALLRDLADDDELYKPLYTDGTGRLEG